MDLGRLQAIHSFCWIRGVHIMNSQAAPRWSSIGNLVSFIRSAAGFPPRTRGRRWMSVEPLESRVLPAVTFSVTFDDPGAEQAAFYSDLEQNTLAAGDTLGQYLAGTAAIEVVIGFSDSIPTANGGSEAVVVFGVDGGITLVQPGAAAEVRTGTDPNGATADLRITIGIDYLTDDVWLDPTPFSGEDPVPADKVDGYSVLLHEIVHAFGIIGYGDDIDGSLPGEFATLFDDQVTFVDGNFFFNGPEATDLYGGPVPLTFGNHFHVGNEAPRPGSELLTDLMNGVIGYLGVRDVISPLDLAILSDTEVPLLIDVGPNTAPDISPQTFMVAEHSANGTTVGTVLATEVDVGQTRTFAILSGNTSGAFSIDPTTGVISVADGSLLEFDTQATYVLSVEVTDNGIPALSDTADMTIDLFERTIPQISTSPGMTTLVKGTSVVIDAAADLVSEPDFTDPEGSKLKATISVGAKSKDQLVIAATGDKATRLKLKKGELKKGKTTIATATGGVGGTPLEITFRSTATVGDVELVLKNLALKGSSKETGTRTIAFQFFLEDGATGDPATKDVVFP